MFPINKRVFTIVILAVFSLICILQFGFAQEQTLPAAPVPTVPQIFTLQGQYVRMAYNNEGFATLGYRTAQNSIGSDWILLNIGLTVRKGTPNYTLTRDHLTLKTPDGTVIPLATQADFNKAGYCKGLVLRDNQVRDSIDYFPGDVSDPCAIRFFGQAGQLSYDQVELSFNRACLGRVFFKLPGKIVPGQYWLNIKFATSEVQVPFRIMTPEEQKIFNDKWQEMKEEHESKYKQQ